MKQLFQSNFFILLTAVLLMSVSAYADIDVQTTDVSCKGKDDGKATISVTGASGNFKYSIDGSSFQSSNTFDNLKPGSYVATVQDDDTKCKFTKPFTINEPDDLSVNVSGGGTFTFCQNTTPPKITLTASASGGTPPFNYSWPGGSITVSSSGTYTVTVTDKNGCTANRSVVVTIIPVVCSKDPNDIVGPVGTGTEKWVSHTAVLPYSIRFENDPKFATAPAQVVKINQPLDPNVNIYSLRLGDFGFGSFHFQVPQNRNYYSTRLDLRDSLGIMLDVVAGIDVTKNEVFWVFKSIDPATGLPPSDASKGFLLVNDSLSRGEGFVSYTVKPQNTTVTGDSIYAKASIVFDINEAIPTPRIFNTIDAVAPVSSVDSTPAHKGAEYHLTVSADDENGKGSGLATYDLYVSENGGDFAPLVTDVPIDSAYLFTGKEGSSYCVFSRAKDKSGNIEALKTAGEVCFSIPKDVSLAIVQPVPGNSYCSGGLLPVTWKSHGVSQLALFYAPDSAAAEYTPVASNISAKDSVFLWNIPASLATGNYRLLLRDASDSTLTAQSTFVLRKAEAPVISSSKGTLLCFGDSTVIGTTAPFAGYRWSTGDTSATIVARKTGMYSVEITDGYGCTNRGTISIIVLPEIFAPVISVSGPTSFCQGDSVILSAPADKIAYLWSTGATTQTITVKSTGNYTVVVKDSNGCVSPVSAQLAVKVNPQLPKPAVTANGALTFCTGGSVALFAPGGYLSYLWSTGETNQSIVVESSGSYTVTVEDVSGCSSIPSDPVVVFVSPKLPKPVISASGPLTFCTGGSIVLTAPFGFASYLWSNGDTTRSITVSSSGTFTVSVKDSSGCASEVSDAVAVAVGSKLAKPVITASGPLTFCQGGQVVLSAPAGFAAYLWSNGDTTRSITVNSSGTFTVSVKDSSGCESDMSDAVAVVAGSKLAKPVITASGPLTFCQGGQVVLSAPAGFAAYLWSNGDTTRSITVSSSGTFTVSVKDSSGCESDMSDAVAVVAGSKLAKPVITASGPLTFCQGGQVVLSAPAGFAAYHWSNGDTTRSITVSSSGTFAVSVKDSSGCESDMSDAVAVVAGSKLAKPVITASGPLTFCQGGQVVLSAPAGFAAYHWSNGDTTRSITVSSSGTFTVSVKDSSGCESDMSDAVAVVAGSKLAKPVITASGPLTFCTGGSVVLSAPFGFAAYRWSSGDTTRSITVTTNGSYIVSVKDSSGCESEYSDAVTVVVGSELARPTVTASGPLTFCSGSVVLSAPAGFASYHWSSGDTTSSVTVSSSGTFTVYVEDTTGCKSQPSEPVSVVKADQLPIPVVTASGALTFCAGDSVILSAPAGFASYHWSTGDSTRSIAVKSSGYYNVSVSDSAGCQSPLSNPVNIKVKSLPAPVVTASGPLTFCDGDSVMLSAPAGYKSYLWSNGATTASIRVKKTGIYTVSVKDTSGCRSASSSPVTVTVNPLPARPDITASGPLMFCQGGSVMLSAPSGYAGYSWSNGATTQTITVSAEGYYKVSVIDTMGCKSLPSYAGYIRLYSTPDKPVITAKRPLTFCDWDSTILSAPLGYAAYLWSTGDTSRSIVVKKAGTFTVSVKTDKGCTSPVSDPVTTIVRPAPPRPVITASGPLEFCPGGSVILSAPSGYDNYHWSTGATTASIKAKTAGKYTVSVWQNGGCPSAKSPAVFVIVDSLPPTPVITASGPLSFCKGDSVILSAPSGYDYYYWSTGSGKKSIVVKASGSYTVAVKKPGGCESNVSAPAIVSVAAQPAKPVITVKGNTTFCKGDYVNLYAPSGYNYYRWSNGATTRSITVYNTGKFAVSVANAEGCFSRHSDSVALTELPPLTVKAGHNRRVYYGYADSACTTLSAVVSGRTSDYKLRWNTGATTADIKACPTETMAYNVKVTDLLYGCTARDTVIVCVTNVKCGPDNNMVLVCHNKKENPKELCVTADSARTLLARGDLLGPCSAKVSCTSKDLPVADEIAPVSEASIEATPNPFSGSTLVEFSIPEKGAVVLKVYNLAGSEVAKLFEGEVEAGKTYHAVFTPDATLPDGIYFCKLTTQDGQIIVKKIVLQR